MPEGTNQQYLLTQQYKNASNLNARIELHKRFSTSTQSWYAWILEHFTFANNSQILELGCGSAEFWHHNRERIPAGWSVTLSDFSAGMLEDARQNLRDSKHPFAFQVIDAQAIPFADESLDVVIANHMLYHVPDRARALSEIRRILKPGGHFYATTVGETHVRELDDLVGRVANTGVFSEKLRYAFTLESGYDQLTPYFSQVTLDRFIDALVVTEAEPLIAYILSTRAGHFLSEERIQTLHTLIEQELAEHGAIHITKSSGIFVAHK